MSQIKDEKINDTSMNGPNAHHGGPNANHKPKEEFHGVGGGRGGRGNRFQPYGGPNRDRKGPRDNNMVISITVHLLHSCTRLTYCDGRAFIKQRVCR